MNDAVYQARRELLRTLDLPVSQASARGVQRRQALKLAVWEYSLSSLFWCKRLLDILGALAGLVLLAPLFVLVGLAIVIEDGWPVFYAQERVGQFGRLFKFYKFRSMVRNADRIKAELAQQNESGDGVIFKMKRDPRITRVGRFIRRFSIDELPQLLNVLSGDLALVGPRPPLPREVALYSLAERKRLHVKPGLTCLWQIQGRSEIPFKEQVRLDMQYIHSQSVLQDLIIILKTVPAVLLGRGAY
ncbi:MAG: sugar transferase [Candidatus Marinimicrobia bacterium]|nr:sugar transferase [Candidatus Neomarinimicrobiota bacterium]